MPVKVFATAAALIGADLKLRNNVDNVEQFIAGMIFGFVQKDDLSSIQACLTDTQTLATQI